MANRPSKKKVVPRRFSRFYLLFGVFLVVATVLAYWPALHGGFVWDDNAWTTDISRLLKDASGLGSMWTQPTALQQYYPLTGTTFWVDNLFWKSWTFPYHLENVILHLMAVLLFWRLLFKLRVPGAWLAAGIFALHPIMVESVAWITERKNVLSLVFFLGALLAYGRFISFWEKADLPRRRWGAYALAFGLFLLALLSKTTTFSFPAVILLVAWWKQGRIQWRKDILPSLPFFALAIGFSAVTAWLEKNRVGAIGWEWDLSFSERCLIAGRAFWFYLGKLLWPENLCFIYPHWKTDTTSLWQWLLPVAALGSLLSLWMLRRKIGRGPVTAAFFFVGTLFPVLGFMNAYGMRYAFVWDHWVYLSSLGLITLGAALVSTLAKKRPAILPAVALILLPLTAFLTWKQSAMYVDNETLLRTTIAKNPTAFLAYNNLGSALLQRNQPNEAIALFQKSLEINPGFTEPHNNLGNALIRVGRIEEGMEQYRKAITADTSDPISTATSYFNYGNAWLQTGHPEKAIEQFQKSLALNPRSAGAHNNLGCAFLRTGRINEALFAFRKAIENDPGFPDAHDNLGHVLLDQGRLMEATGHFQKALASYEGVIPPDEMATRHNDLGNLLERQNRPDEAIPHFESAITLKPDGGEFHFNLGAALMEKNRLDDAAVHFRRANELMPNAAPPHYRLGLVEQLQNKFGPALVEYQKALDLNPNYLSARNNLIWVLATCPDASLRDGKRAVALAEQVDRSYRDGSPQFMDTLAAAYAESGEFSKAVATLKRALDLSKSDEALTKNLQSRYELYQANTPYHEAP